MKLVQQMNKPYTNEFSNITMTGKICYVFMCIERYLVGKYPNRDWTPVAKRMWQWTTHWWTESWDIYSEVVPEFILEFDTYEETNLQVYNGSLSEETYKEITGLYKGITDGKEEDEFCTILSIPIDFGNACEGTNACAAEPYVLELIEKAESILTKNNIQLPDKSLLKHFEYDKTKPIGLNEKDPGWGDLENTGFLSVVLNN